MKIVFIIYWSGTGNTRTMVLAVAEGAQVEGVTVQVLEVGRASKEDVIKADVMGNEVLEEEEMEPFVWSLEGEGLTGKPLLALVGSYDWGDGQWMWDWQERMNQKGVRLLVEGLIIQNTLDEAGLTKCRELGEKLTAALAD